MSYLEDPYAQSRRAGSTRSKMSMRTVRLALTPIWQHILQLLLPKRAEEDNGDGETHDSELRNAGQDEEEYYTMSGALPNDHICQEFPHLEPCVTGSCSTRAQDQSNAIRYNKPLPPRPHMASGSNAVQNRASFLSTIAKYSTYIDTRFSLDNTERQVLRYLQQLSTDELFDRWDPFVVTVQLGEYEFRMSESHASILQRIHSLTAPLSADVKADLIRNLDHLIEEEHRYPFEEVVASRFRIIRKTPTDMGAGENSGQTGTSTRHSKAGMTMETGLADDLKPAPLRIRKALPVPSRRLSRLSEDTEPKRQVNLSRTQRRVIKARARPANVTSISTTEPHDSSPLDLSYETDDLPPLPVKSPIRSIRRSSSAPYGSLNQRLSSDFTNSEAGHGLLEQTVELPRQPGSVARARNMLHERQRLTRAESDCHMPDQQQSYPLKNSNLPGGVKSRLDGMYLTPRPAPTPPIRMSLLSSYSDPYLIPTRTQSSNQVQIPAKKRTNFWDHAVAKLKQSATSMMSKHIGGLERTRSVYKDRANVTEESDGRMPVTPMFEESHIIRPYVAHYERAVSQQDKYSGGLRGGGEDLESDQLAIPRRLSRHFSALFGRFGRMGDDERPMSGLWFASGRNGGKRRTGINGQLRERSNAEESYGGFIDHQETVPEGRNVRFLQQEAINEEDEEPDEEMVADTSSSVYDTDTEGESGESETYETASWTSEHV